MNKANNVILTTQTRKLFLTTGLNVRSLTKVDCLRIVICLVISVMKYMYSYLLKSIVKQETAMFKHIEDWSPYIVNMEKYIDEQANKK